MASTESMKVCIGITTKNRKEILRKAIESALSQSYSNKEVVVLDDGSMDGTTDLARHYGDVKWIRQEESIGLLEARNRMMKTTNADLFVSLDDDAWFLEKDEIEIAVKEMEENSKLSAISFDVLQANTKRFKPVGRGRKIQTNVFIGCGHMLRLSAVKEAGYYVPFPVKYGHEEKDLCLRLIDLGYQILFLEGVHVWHDYTSVERNFTEQRRSFIINDLIFPFRRVPILYLIPVLVNNILRKLRSKQGDRKLTRAAIWQFFKLIPSQFEYVKRVRISSYRKYLSLSRAYLDYMDRNSQTPPGAK